MGKRIVSAFTWVMATAAVLALVLGICYGMLPLMSCREPPITYVTPLLCTLVFREMTLAFECAHVSRLGFELAQSICSSSVGLSACISR